MFKFYIMPDFEYRRSRWTHDGGGAPLLGKIQLFLPIEP